MIKISAKKKLTVKQLKFIDYYKGNATEAAIKAGYSKKTAYSTGQRNLGKPAIWNALQRRFAKEHDKTVADLKERQERLTEILRKNSAVDEDKAEYKDIIKAIDTLNKMDGVYVQKHQLSLSDSLTAVLDVLPDDVKEQVLEKIKKTVGG